MPIEQINISDHILVKPGERIALDGVVLVGESAVDQASITGESMPVHKEPGDQVFAGTINKNGFLEIGVTRLAKDSTIARLIQMVEEAQSEKAETQRFIDKYEQYYAVAVIVLTGLAIVVPPLLLGEAPDRGLLPRHDHSGRRLTLRHCDQHAGHGSLRHRQRRQTRRPCSKAAAMLKMRPR